MAVPDTNTFSLSDVITEVSPALPTLSSCFSAAVSANFDPAYSGAKDRLSNFRNYKESVEIYTSYLGNGASTSNNACLDFINGIPYYSTAPLNVGVVIYTNTGLTVPFSGGNLWYLFECCTVFQINNSGVIIDANGCAPL